MAGLLGTTLMLMETSGCGALLHLDRLPVPESVPLARWLVSFPSYGFLLSVRPDRVARVQQRFGDRQLACVDLGEIQPSRQLVLELQGERQGFWDLAHQPLTGFTPT